MKEYQEDTSGVGGAADLAARGFFKTSEHHSHHSECPIQPLQNLSEEESLDEGLLNNFNGIVLAEPTMLHIQRAKGNGVKNNSPENPFAALQTLNQVDTTDDNSRIPLASSISLPAETLLISLTIDSLHWIASFLLPMEWAKFGHSSKAANRVCKQIFQRVRMHGFRCATEVVTAWKLDQHADAKELCALYIDAGVPIYPSSLSHSYHTLIWRMGIESREMQLLLGTQNGNAISTQRNVENNTTSEEPPVDRFYAERAEIRSRDIFNSTRTYLEEKSMHKLSIEENENSNGIPLSIRRQLSAYPDSLLLADLPRRNRNPLGSMTSSTLLSQPSRIMIRSNSQANLCRHTPKVNVKVHRHLLDQHLLGRPGVDDDEGAMTTPALSLSADFYHPCFLFRPVNHRGNHQTYSNSSNSPLNDTSQSGGLLPAWNNPPNPDSANSRFERDLSSSSGGRNLDEFIDFDDSEDDEPLVRHADIIREIPIQQDNAPAIPASRASAIMSDSRPMDSFVMSQMNHNVLNNVNLDVYSASSSNSKSGNDDIKMRELKKKLRLRFEVYQKHLENLLARHDNHGFEECILDFWDEFFPHTANIHYYDRRTPVPRASSMHKFLTTPCPKAIGIVQCEIERIKLSNKKKGVNMKGRLFPTYEYRVFIRHQPSNSLENSNAPRKDTVLMTAKNRARPQLDPTGRFQSSSASKKGSNYYLYLPRKDDADRHYEEVNEAPTPYRAAINGAGIISKLSADKMLVGRLQSNFIGTEFQIFTPPKIQKKKAKRPMKRPSTGDALDRDINRGADLMPSSSFRRKNRFGRLSLRRYDSTNDVRDRFESSRYSEENISSSKIQRSLSSSELGFGRRSSKHNRRAIANTNETFDLQSMLFEEEEEEDGAITYTANLLGSRPRIMDVCIPKVTDVGAAGVEWKKYLGMSNDVDLLSGRRMLDRLKEMQQRMENEEQDREGNQPESRPEISPGYSPPDDFGLLALQNRPPWWNVELGSFVLNFGGRVQVASVKNFQLCDRNDQDYIMLQFGRIQGRHSFTMDFQYPLTAVQAFAIAISSLQSKISFG